MHHGSAHPITVCQLMPNLFLPPPHEHSTNYTMALTEQKALYNVTLLQTDLHTAVNTGQNAAALYLRVGRSTKQNECM